MKLRTFLAALALAAPLTLAAHEHLAAGFLDANRNGLPDAGEPLRLTNPPAAGTIFHLLPRATGNYGGFYSLDEFSRPLFPADYFTFVGLSDGQAEAADPAHAATGAYLWVEIVSVTGPDGGHFGFWDENRSYFASTPTASFPVGQPTENFGFVISEPINAGGADEDPYGHIHNRGWTADLPGTYVVGFRVVDRSTNGPGGGPIHPASPIYQFTFLAGDGTATPTPTPTPAPPGPAEITPPTLKIIGAKSRVVSSKQVVLKGRASAGAGIRAVQMKLNSSAYRAIATTENWKASIRPLKPGPNRISVRTMDARGVASRPVTLTVRRLR